MKIFNIAKNEAKILLKDRYVRLSLFVVTLIPLLYGALYLWAFWDPYKNMKDVPIAIVNNDDGTTRNQANYNFGDQIVENLKSNDNFDWKFVSQDDADNGLNDKKYYAEIIIPDDFSANIVSVDSDNPEQAILQLKTRGATNMLASQISDSATKQIVASVGDEISKNYFNNIFLQTQNLAQGLQDAATGSSALASGLLTAKSGSLALADATSSAYSGSESLVSGINQALIGDNGLDSGISQTLVGAGQLDSGISLAASGAKSLVSGSAQVKSGISQVNAGLSTLLSNVSSTTTSLQTVQIFIAAENHPTATFSTSDATNPLYALSGQTYKTVADYIIANNSELAGKTYAECTSYIIDEIVTTSTSSETQTQISSLQTGMTQLSAGGNQLDSGINSLSSSLNNQIKPGSKALVSALSQLNSGSKTLNSGLSDLATGNQNLSTGLTKISSGSSELSSGISTASDGATTLATKLTDGAKSATEASDPTKTEQESILMSTPIKLSDVSIDKVANYGTGFAPYFIPLALWVGALILFLVIKVNETSFAEKASRVQIIISKYFTFAIFGTLQAIVMDTVLIQFLGLAPAHLTQFYLFTILASWCFVAILQFLISKLDEAGKFIGIVLLMLQLTSAAGTFPLETAPKFFQIINPYLPMTYVVSGLRELISGNNMQAVVTDTLILASVGLIFFLLNLIVKHHIYRVGEENITGKNELVSASEIN